LFQEVCYLANLDLIKVKKLISVNEANHKENKMAMHGKKGNGKTKPMSGGKKPMNGNGLTAAQKKLPPALQKAILKKKKAKK
jgi:hypothetical protein